jgi:CspA family cold shock protein
MEHSTVKWFDAKKGYGFINHPDDGEDVFVHYSNINSDDDFKTLETGQRVKFEMNDGPKGLHALDVIAVDEETTDADSPQADSTPEIDPAELDPTAEVDPMTEAESSSG